MAFNNLILDRYRPLGSAGTGGFGTVQVAWDQRIQRKVAIKTIRLSELDAFRAALPGAEAVAGSGVDASLQRREPLPWEDDAEYEAAMAAMPEAGAAGVPAGFAEGGDAEDADDLVPALAHIPGLDEARTAAKLTDPRIVAVYDFEVRDRMAYLIMEYVEGLTLTQLLDLYGDQLSLDEVAAVFQSVAGALQLAHESGVLHLDIKPDNILINAKGQVKVTDFGLATLADAAGLGTTGGGTIGYMPPEQMRRENLDARCDEWSLAAIAYEMLTGTNPFIVPSLDQAEQAILDAELVLPSLCWEDLDAQIDDVVFYALDPDRQERYATVADFAEEMGKFLGDAEFGQQRLAALVSAELGLDDDAEDDLPWAQDDGDFERPERPRRVRRPLSERITPRTVALGGRICAALLCGFIGAAAVSNMPFLLVQSQSTPAIVMAGALVAGVLGLLRPDVGALVAFGALATALVLANSPLPGIVLLVATVLWWYFCGRRGVAQSNAALSGPLAGAVGLGVFTPLAAGAYLRPAMAAGTACFAAVVALVMGSFGSLMLFGWDAFSFAHFARIDVQGHFLAMLTAPSTWAVAASWVVAAWVEALLGTRLGRFGVGAGYVLAAAILALGVVASAAFGPGVVTAAASASASAGAAASVTAGPPFMALLPIAISLAILVAAEFALRALASDD